MFGKVKTCVLNMPMNEGQGHPHDSSGYGNNGTNNGAVWTSGDYGWALDFNGSSDYVDCGAGPSLEVNTGSISTWFLAKPNQLTYGGRIVEIGSANDRVGLHVWGDHKLHLFAKIAIVTTINILSTDNFDDSTWHYAVGTWNGSGAKLYADGIETDSDGGDKTLSLPSFQCNVGNGTDGGDRWFNGSIDDVRIHNRALSATEILAYFNATKARYGL